MACSPTQLLSDREKESRETISIVVEAYDDVLECNKTLEEKYKAREEAMRKTLHEVQARLVAIKEAREAKIKAKNEQDAKKSTEKLDAFRYYNVGKPYFKDEHLNQPPDNEDTLLMKQFNMYDNSHVMSVSGWTHGDKTRLLAVLLDMSKDIIKEQLKSKIAELQRIKVKTSSITCKIAQLKREMVALKHKTLENMGIQADQDFDWDEVAMKLNKRHSPREYKAIWELFFHPSINKRSWTRNEHQELQRLAAEKKMQDWDSIAKALNTGRTGYQCFVYFRTNVRHAACGRKWTHEEMEYLQRVIDFYRDDNYIPWGKVAAAIENRTKIQCYNKYLRMVEGRKGRFIPEEDAVILNFVNVYGTDFRKMSSFLSGRSAIQLRVRYNLLLKMRLSATWTVEDDKKLLQIMANQESRANFSTATRHFPGKDRQNIRSRYNTLIRWIKSHPNIDVSMAPRRGPRRLAHGEPTSNLVKAVHAFRAKINGPLQLKPKKVNKLTKKSSESFLHESILSTIAAIEIKKQQGAGDDTNMKKVKVDDSFQMLRLQDIASTPRDQSNLSNIQHILILLNAKLANRKAFYKSNIGKGFEAFENQMPKVDELRVMKSYSKKKVTTTDLDVQKCCEKPTIFGPITGHRKFLFPPNFATVTGARVILNQLNNFTYLKDTSETNINQLARMNVNVQEKLTQLQERFNDLFIWPFILSNESPEYYSLYAKNLIESRAKAKPFIQRPLPEVPGVTIPPPPPRRLRLKKGKDRGIDAVQVQDLKDINLEKQFHE